MNKKFAQLLLIGLSILICYVPANSLAASKNSQDPSQDISDTIIKNYKADSSVVSGMIVGYKGKDRTTVVPLTNKTARDMLGVVVPVDSAPFALTAQTGSTGQVLVATSGDYQALVSTQSGNIKKGDYLTMSALPGIAMKSSAYQEEIVGTAEGDFSGGQKTIQTVPIKNGQGKTMNVSIGTLPVSLRLAPNPTYVRNNSLPGVLTTAANAVANKTVSLIQIYLSIALLCLTFFVVGVIFYGAVRSSLISIGRNPLSRSSVIAGLLKVVFIGLIILGAGLVGSYLVLKF